MLKNLNNSITNNKNKGNTNNNKIITEAISKLLIQMIDSYDHNDN